MRAVTKMFVDTVKKVAAVKNLEPSPTGRW
jgi:hypothetical protein